MDEQTWKCSAHPAPGGNAGPREAAGATVETTPAAVSEYKQIIQSFSK